MVSESRLTEAITALRWVGNPLRQFGHWGRRLGSEDPWERYTTPKRTRLAGPTQSGCVVIFFWNGT